jgi:large subunit ribosomal protein L27
MAHKKAGGSTSLGRESQSKRLGVKMTTGQLAKPGCILVRQRGTKFHAGKNVRRGKDDTLYSVVKGKVKFMTRKLRKFDGKLRTSKVVNVIAE